MQRNPAAQGERRRTDLAVLHVKFAALHVRPAPCGNHPLCVTLAQSPGIGVHGVEQHLHFHRASPLQVAVEIRWNHHAGVQFIASDGGPHRVRGKKCATQFEAAALRHVGDQFTAGGGVALVQHAQPQVGNRRVEGEAEQHQLHHGRKNE